MPADTENLARRALARIRGFEAIAATARLVRMQGLTNRVFRVEADSAAYVLRMPDPRTGDLIDRRAEAANARAAAKLGIAPKIVHFGLDGVLLMRFVEGTAMSPAAFRDRPGALERTAVALAHLHGSGIAFARDFRLFETIDRYLAEIGGAANPPSAVSGLRPAIERIREALAGQKSSMAPCHCDPTPANIIDTGEQAVFLDWEFSAMNDPLFDLAYLSVEGEFDSAQEARLLAACRGPGIGAAEHARFVLHKALVDYLSALWDLIRTSRGERFATDAGRRLARCAALVRRPEFDRCVAAVRRSG